MSADADVLVVGYGPIGQVLSVLLARRGWRVAAVERWEKPYPLPRATSFDGETARTLASLGIGSRLAEIGEAADAYEWRNAGGRTLVRTEFSDAGHHGWPDATTMHQPALEAVLADRAAQYEQIRVLRGHTATAIADDGGAVTLTARTAAGQDRTLTAPWLVGCDGANSFTRAAAGIGVTDLGFSYDWLLCDVVLHEPRVFVPANLQICDPARPTTVVASGPGHRRWEFMRLPGEQVAQLDRAETAWRLLEPFDVTPDNARLARHAVYTFRAAWADTWRAGRVLLAGDAAHAMPPFTGQGMCSGIRDALNLAWKLDLVLRGHAADRLLDSYTTERRGHVRTTIDTAVKLGGIVCVSDEREAAARDAALLAGVEAGRGAGRPATLPLREGLLYKGIGTVPSPPAGWVVPQGRVSVDGVSGLFDQVVGTGFTLLAAADPDAALDERRREFLDGLPARVARIVPSDSQGHAAPGAVIDLDDVYLPFLASAKVRFALVRPDYHVFGGARTTRELIALLDQSRDQLAVEAGHLSRN